MFFGVVFHLAYWTLEFFCFPSPSWVAPFFSCKVFFPLNFLNLNISRLSIVFSFILRLTLGDCIYFLCFPVISMYQHSIINFHLKSPSEFKVCISNHLLHFCRWVTNKNLIFPDWAPYPITPQMFPTKLALQKLITLDAKFLSFYQLPTIPPVLFKPGCTFIICAWLSRNSPFYSEISQWFMKNWIYS